VIDGFRPFSKQIRREITAGDVDHLLKIVILLISLYDINKTKKEIMEIQKRLKEIKHHLSHITDYAIFFLENNIIGKYKSFYPRKTKIISIDRIDVREAAQRNLKLRYDSNTGYLGYEVSGNVLFDVSQYDRILVIRRTGSYSVISAPKKMFVDRGMHYCGFADQQTTEKTIFTVIYKNEKGHPYIKRCRIEKFIFNKGYSLVPDNCTVLKISTLEHGFVMVSYKPKPRLRVLQENFNVSDYAVKGVKAKGVRLAGKEARSARLIVDAEANR